MKQKSTINFKLLRQQFRRFWTESEQKTRLYQRIKKQLPVDQLVEEAELMEAWCAKSRKTVSLLRFNNWLKNNVKWTEQRKQKQTQEVNNEEEDQEAYARRKTKEYLERFGKRGQQ